MDEENQNSESKEVNISKEISGLKINLGGQATGMSVDGLSGSIEGPQGLFLIDLSVAKDGDNYIITGQGNFVKEPLQGAISATVEADSSFNPDMSSLVTQGQASINKEFSGVKINLTGGFENGRLSNLSGTIEGLNGAYIISASIEDNGEGYTITGSGELLAGPVQGSATAEIMTDDSFNIDPSSLNISGSASVNKDVSGVLINLEGVLENGKLASLSGTVEGLGGAYVIAASVVDNGDGYTITGSGDFTAGPVQGSASAQIEADTNFSVDSSSLNISGEAAVDTEMSGLHINLQGAIEKGRLASLAGSVEGMGGAYLISASVEDNGEGYTISGSGNFVAGPIQGTVEAQIDADNNFSVDPGSLNISGQINYDQDFSSIKVSLFGAMENNRVSEFAGTIIGPGDAFTINVTLVDNGTDYLISGEGAFTAGPIQGNLLAEITADDHFNIDPSTLLISGDVNVDANISGIQIIMAGSLVESRLANLSGNVIGPGNMFDLAVSVVDNGEGYTISGSGDFAIGPVQGSATAQIETDNNFSIDPSSINISGEAAVDKEMSGLHIDLQGAIENGRLASLAGTVEGMGGAYLISASVEDNGEGYTISGAGNFVAGPIQGTVEAQIDADNNFSVDPGSLNISGQIGYDQDLSSIKVSLFGAMENNRISEFTGTIIGPGDAFTINVALVDSGTDYLISGEGAFTAGPIQGNLLGEVTADNNFNIDPSTFLVSGDVNVDSNISGIQIIMAGSLVESRLANLSGNIIGPNNMFDLAVSVIDNGEGYTVSGSGEFTAGPAVGTLTGQIDTDNNFNPLVDTLDVGGDVYVNTDVLGNHVEMSGTMEHMSLQSLIGTIEGPNGMYLLTASVEDNGEGYTIIATGDFHAGPIEGTVTGQINTDKNFSPDFDTLSISGEADVDTETAGHHIMMKGVMENGRLVSLDGTVVGPSDLYTITASITDNGDGYTIIGDGTIEKDIIKGHVHGEINTDDNFNPDFETLNFGGEVTIESESAGQKISGTAIVNNGYLESITAEMEGPGGLYTLYAQGVREEEGYDLEAGAEFQFFKSSLDYEFPPIIIPTGVPGLNIDIEIGMGFEADASAQLIAGIKTDPHFIPDISTFEIRAATILGHGSVYVDIFGGLSVNLGIASVAVGIKAKLEAILDAYMTMTADSKGFKLSGNLYGQLMGSLYAAIKMKFLFFKKEFDFLLVEGMVASLEKDFGPEDFTIENLIKAFAFGFDNFSLPGKERKGKTPSLEDQRKKNEEETSSAADEDQNAKEEEKAKKDDESSSDDSGSETGSEEPKKLSKSEKEDKFKEGGGPDAAQMKTKDSSEPAFQLQKNQSGNSIIEEVFEPIQMQEIEESSIGNVSEPVQMQETEEPSFDDVSEPAQMKENEDPLQFNSSNGSSGSTVQKKSDGGLPSNLQSGVEKLSGQDMSNVNVNYNSDKPAQLNAHAYAQGNNIHLGPGQEKHLPHEAWHVAQQKQGRVQPTKQMKSKVNINDDPALEKEADVMGAKAAKIGSDNEKSLAQLQSKIDNSDQVSQLIAFDNQINDTTIQEASIESNSIDQSDSISNDQSSETITN